MRGDLHLHSAYSDGSATVIELIQQAVSKGLTHIAITDHDRVPRCGDIPPVTALKVMPGIEISAYDFQKQRKAHILGYAMRDTRSVTAFCRPLLERRQANSLRQIALLAEHGFRIRPQNFVKRAGHVIYKQHLMEYLVATEQVEEMFGTFYHETFKNGGYCDFDIEYLDAAAAVRVITEAGGLAVLAHPGQQQNLELVPELVGYGLKGIELEHRKNTEADKEAIRQMAVQYGLFLTGGSDYHGTLEDGSSELGSCLATENALRIIFNNNSINDKKNALSNAFFLSFMLLFTFFTFGTLFFFFFFCGRTFLIIQIEKIQASRYADCEKTYPAVA